MSPSTNTSLDTESTIQTQESGVPVENIENFSTPIPALVSESHPVVDKVQQGQSQAQPLSQPPVKPAPQPRPKKKNSLEFSGAKKNLGKFEKYFFRWFPTPSYIAMPHVGVDITANAIRYIELVKSYDGLKLKRYGTQDLASPISMDGNLANNADLMAALKKIQRANKLSFVEVSIPEEKAYLFTTEVPVGDDDVVRSHIEFHLEENVPISLSEAVFDYYVIKRSVKRGVDFASVAVVPRSVIDDYVDLFKKCDMTPISFLIENQAVTKAIIKEDDYSTYLVVNFGQKKTVLSVVSEQALQFTSTVSIGGDDFINAIMKENNVSRDEAVRMKVSKGFTRNPDNASFFMSLVNAASALRDEIERVRMYWLSYMEKSGKDTSIPFKILLAGEDSSIIGFREYMALSLKIQVELANVWINVLSFDEEIPPIEYLESLDYATVIGLALPKSGS